MIPLIKNQSVIEMSEVSPPTKVSSKARFTNKVYTFYKEKR